MTSTPRPDPSTAGTPAGPGSGPGSGPDVAGQASAKRERRRRLLTQRRELHGDVVAAASRRIVAHLCDLPEVQQARRVLLYVADPDEIDLSELIDGPPAGCAVLLPRVEGDELVTVRHSSGGSLVAGELGVREPTGPSVDPSDVDVVIVPGVAFDPQGGRLGRGKGLYDRFLAQLPDALRIGVCMEQFVVAELPLEAHDVRMDLVVSDAAVRRRDAFDPTAPA